MSLKCLVFSKQFAKNGRFSGKITLWGLNQGDCEGVMGVLEVFVRIILDGNFLENPMDVVLERQGCSVSHEIELIFGL